MINELSNLFLTEFAPLFQTELAKAELEIVLVNIDEDPTLQKQAISSLVEYGVTSFIISLAYGDEASTLAMSDEANTPTL